jgi:hypothetical protein
MAAIRDKVRDSEFDGVVKFSSHGTAREVTVHIREFPLSVN